jgi:general secretion pathway protein D
MLNALASKSLLKVISSPSLMVQDNFTANIAAGTQQPVNAGTTISGSANLVTTNIQYKDTGVNLSVTPSVNAGNMVNMLINQSVTDLGSLDDATQQYSFLQRQISTKVAVRSGETLVLGGLIRDNSSNGRSGLPVLQDIPVVGKLFGSTTKVAARTELLLTITPRVVRSDQELRDVSNDLRLKMQGLSLMTPVAAPGAQGPASPPAVAPAEVIVEPLR